MTSPRHRSLVCLALLPLLLVIAACPASTTPPNAQALKILDVTRSAVASAVTVFNADVAAGKVPEATRLKAIQLRQQYLAADKLAVDSLAVTTITDASGYTTAVSKLAADLIAFLSALKVTP